MPDSLSLGRIQAGFAQASQELTVAAANLNFDFTLVKVEALPEYQPLGKVLSASRVREAETGPLHVTARRLGALFEGVCPETPNLITAYGTRASEISREVSEKDSGVSRSSNWIRTEYGGIDATSIWAAATSSKAALPAHLLACILARMWKHTEATSLWVEIVSERKREIVKKFEEGEYVPTSLASAVQQEITRDHLAKWDASARSWLQTADLARQREYKQFLLIIQNVSIAIHEANVALYPNVVHVWNSALAAMEGLVSGRPYVVRDGPVLLGLSAWHIYPDMVIFDGNSCNKHVAMRDDLVKDGGVLSLGISEAGRQEEQSVYWSLSLAHHRFYGEAVKQTRRLNVDGSRLTLSELMLICLGSLLRRWSISPDETHTAFKILLAIAHVYPKGDNVEFDTGKDDTEDDIENGWRAVIEEPILQFFRDEKQAILAVSLGRRRPNFLPAGVTTEERPLFLLSSLQDLMSLLIDVDKKIELLRRVSARVTGLNKDNSIILCFDGSHPTRSNYTFATVFPEGFDDEDTSKSRKRNSGYHRWVTPLVFQSDGGFQDDEGNHFSEEFRNLEHHYPGGIAGDPFLGASYQDDHYDEDTTEGARRASYIQDSISGGSDTLLQKDIEYLEDLQRRLPGEKVEYLDSSKKAWSYNPQDETVKSYDVLEDAYGLLFGQIIRDDAEYFGEHAAVYLKAQRKIRTSARRSLVPVITLEDVLWCFQSGFIDPDRLKMLLESDAAFSFFKVLWAVSKVYREPSSGGASISAAIVDSTFEPPILPKKLLGQDWVKAHSHLVISQGTAISLIGYFETGYNIVEAMKGNYNIIGLSGGDSIFVLTAVWCLSRDQMGMTTDCLKLALAAERSTGNTPKLQFHQNSWEYWKCRPLNPGISFGPHGT